MKITVKTFATVKDLCGFDDREFTVADSSRVADLITELMKTCPKLSGIRRSLLFAINEEYSTEESALKSGDTLAIFPPVSGG